MTAMRKDFTDITIVLDRSGSMESVADDTIGGFNRFLLDQKQAPGDGVLTLVQFDHEYEFVHRARPLAEVPPLSRETFVPRGQTALLDAIGRTLNDTFERLAKTDEAQLPGSVIFVILTDGHENASREFSRETVFKMISERQAKQGWTFVFLGANQDAIEAGGGLGIAAGTSLSYAATPDGVRLSVKSLSTSVLRARLQQKADFDESDREEQRKRGAR
jgi:Mg-chelatase subunit ChlD